jgi:hypothetical protein
MTIPFPLLLQPISKAEWEQSKTLVQQALEAKPGDAEIWTLRGILAARAKQYPLAHDSLLQAVSLAPASAEPRLTLIELYLLFGRLDAARAQLEQAGKVDSCVQDPRMASLTQTLRRLEPVTSPVDLSDVTFLIPFRADSSDRTRNLGTVLRYLHRHARTSVIVCEDEPGGLNFPRLAAGLGEAGSKCEFIRAPCHPGGFIHRTRDLNLLVDTATTPIVAIYDTDVVLAPVQYLAARDAVKNGTVMALPYNGLFIDVAREQAAEIDRALAVDGVDALATGNTVLHSHSFGGVIFYDRRALMAAGGYNENFVSWGYEDLEILARFQTLKMPVTRTPGPLLHLPHVRTGNSSDQHPFYEKNQRELAAVRAMNADEIRVGVASGRFRDRSVS